MASTKRSDTSTKQLDTSMKQLDTSTKQWNMSNWKATTKLLCVNMKMNKIQVYMILRANRRLHGILKINKRHVMVIFVSMNAVNTSIVQHTNVCVHKQLYLSFIWNILFKSTKITMKILNIVLWLIKNLKDMQHIWNWNFKFRKRCKH